MLAAANGVRDHVDVTGHVPDDHLVDWYRGAALHVMPSLYEPFGMTGLEAMAVGTPTVLSSRSGLAEYVSPGTHAAVVDPADVAALGDVIAAVLGNEGRSRRMGLRGCRLARTHFAWDQIGATFRRLFVRLLSK